jgi:hypothetical protein
MDHGGAAERRLRQLLQGYVRSSAARQPEKHHHAKDRQANAEPHESALPTFPGVFGQCWQGHAALVALGFL